MAGEKLRFVQVGGYDWVRLTPLLEQNLKGVTTPIRYGTLIPDDEKPKTAHDCTSCFCDECQVEGC